MTESQTLAVSAQAEPSIAVVDRSTPKLADKPLRIALLGYRSAPFSGGQGIYIKYLSRALTAMGHKVDVISGEPYPQLDDNVTLIKMPGLNLYEWFPDHHRALRLKHFASWADLTEYFSMLTGGFSEPYSFGRRVAKYLKKHQDQYDIVHDNQCLAYGLLDIQRFLPTIATLHHPITHDRQLALDAAPNWKYRLLTKRWYSFLGMQKKVTAKLKHVVTVSDQSRRDTATDFGVPDDHLKVIYNGIDTHTFKPLDNPERSRYRLICTASADQPLKGLRYLLEALPKLAKLFPQLQLTVVGKLQPEGPTEKLIQKLGIADRIQFVSGISTERLVELYSESTIAICPSLYEGFGLPAGEAMACGVPVISSNGGALPEVVGNAGIIVPKGDSEALGREIAKLLDNPQHQKQLSYTGRARIENTFSWAAVAQELTEYYEKMLSHADR